MTDYDFDMRRMKPRLSFFALKVTAITPQGYWIAGEGLKKPKIQLNGAKARWAYPTKDEAFHAFSFRKRKHIRILESELDYAKDQLRLAELYENCEALDRLLPLPMA